MNQAELPQKTIMKVMEELKAQVKRPPPELYCFPKNIGAAYELSNDFGKRQSIINDLTQNICFYMGILSVPRVRLLSQEFYAGKDGQLKKDAKEQAGAYYVTRTEKIITITYSREKSLKFETAAAIVAHECCHHYLHMHGIQSRIVDDEILTDLTAVYLGLGFMLFHGCFSQEMALGYISKDTLKSSLKRAAQCRQWDKAEVKARWKSMFQTKHRISKRSTKKQAKEILEKIGSALIIVLVIGILIVWVGIYFVYLAPYSRYFFSEVLSLPAFPAILHVVPMFVIPIIAGALIIWLLLKIIER